MKHQIAIVKKGQVGDNYLCLTVVLVEVSRCGARRRLGVNAFAARGPRYTLMPRFICHWQRGATRPDAHLRFESSDIKEYSTPVGMLYFLVGVFSLKFPPVSV